MEGVSDHREARRPMNSFFIFCKRHRSMVRDHHQNLDNRSISRILGELWAKLDPREKQQYTATAKQYKDAFLKANPDYKWHNNDKSHLMSASSFAAISPELTIPDKNHEKVECFSESPVDSNNMDVLFMAIQQNNNNKEDFSTQVLKENTNGPRIEGAAGESPLITRKDDILSSTPIKHELGNVNANIEYAVKQGWACANEEESCIATTPDSKFPDYPAKDSPSPSTSSPTHTSQKDGNDSDSSKSHKSDSSGDTNWAKASNNCRQVDYTYRGVHLPTRKSKRANKGAIYKNLIATGALPASRERLAEIQTIYNVNSDDGSEMKDTPMYEQSIRRFKRTASESDPLTDKRYKTGDFDLDAKIATLPACSMAVLEKNRRNATKPSKSSPPENSRRPLGANTASVMKTDMLLTPPRRRQRPHTSPVVGCRKRKQGPIMRFVPLSDEYRHHLPKLTKTPLAQFYLHPTMKSYQNLLVRQKSASSPEPATSTSDESFEGKDDRVAVAKEVRSCGNQKARKVVPADVPTTTTTAASTSLTIPKPTTTKTAPTKTTPTSNTKVSIQEKPILYSAAVKAECRSVAAISNTKCSVLVTPPMPTVYQAAVSSVDTFLRSPQVTDISAQMAAARAPNMPLAAVAAAAAVSEPMQTPVALDLGPTSGLHLSGELKVKLGSQSPTLSENPDFKLWITNLAEAAERAGQISVC